MSCRCSQPAWSSLRGLRAGRVRPVAAALAAVGLMASVGCSGQQADKTVKRWFARKNPQQQMLVALEDEDADARRKAIEAIARSSWVRSDQAVKALAAIARTDPEPTVRCAAIRALGRCYDTRPVEPLWMILNYADYPDQVRPPPVQVRWDAVEVLAECARLGLIPLDKQQAVCETLIAHALDDESRDVRIAAVRALAAFQNRRALQALISALHDSDFGVVFEAERSLIALTGRTFRYDADAWQAWLNETADPFERAGQVPESLRGPKRNWLQRAGDAVRRAILRWQGQAKEP